MNVEIAERLAAKRKEHGYSQEDLASRLGVSRQAVSKWERSESSPDTDNLIALAQLYGVSLDDLLYVDEELKDDIAFEAADKASAPSGGSSPDSAVPEPPPAPFSSSAGEGEGEGGFNVEGKHDEKVHIGSDGIHVLDGDDYVHVSWRDGIHVKDGKKGDEVHVGPDGIFVNDGSGSGCGDDWKNRKDWGKEEWKEWGKDWKDAGHRHDRKPRKNAFLRFPFALLVIIAYLLAGFLLDAWALGLLLFFLIPVYYIIVNGFIKREIAPAIAGIYPLAAVAFFCYMAFALDQPHPAWVVFLTIPIVEWMVISPSRWWKRRKEQKRAQRADGSIPVEPLGAENEAHASKKEEADG